MTRETSFTVIFRLNNCSFIVNFFYRVVSSRYLLLLVILYKMWGFNLFLRLKLLKTLCGFWIFVYTFIRTFIYFNLICHILSFAIRYAWQIPTRSLTELVLGFWLRFGLWSEDIDSSVVLWIVVMLMISATHINLNEDLRLSHWNNCRECYVFFV